jgi:hypothetical protein
VSSPIEHRLPNPLLTVIEPWLSAWRFAAVLGWTGLASAAQFSNSRELRKVWSTNLSEAVDRSLRSPEFLRLMACTLRFMADAARFTSPFQSK